VLREIGANGEVERGRREIDPEAARIIRRIFEEYVAGRSPRAIAADLNREGVPSPRVAPGTRAPSMEIESDATVSC
jgi:hypothetical protein